MLLVEHAACVTEHQASVSRPPYAGAVCAAVGTELQDTIMAQTRAGWLAQCARSAALDAAVAQLLIVNLCMFLEAATERAQACRICASCLSLSAPVPPPHSCSAYCKCFGWAYQVPPSGWQSCQATAGVSADPVWYTRLS
jgi:hypothetical protein